MAFTPCLGKLVARSQGNARDDDSEHWDRELFDRARFIASMLMSDLRRLPRQAAVDTLFVPAENENVQSPSSPSSSRLIDLVRRRAGGIKLFGLAPPRRDTPEERLREIATRHRARLGGMPLDGIVVYDLQNEPGRNGRPRPFPFLPTLDPAQWSDAELAPLGVPRIVYRSVNGLSAASLQAWLLGRSRALGGSAAVLVGAPTAESRVAGLSLSEAYQVAQREAPEVLLGGIAIAERHARRLDEHERLARKVAQGCRFFVTQAVYDPSATRSLVSDYAVRMSQEGVPPPLILTFSPCGSIRTLELMQWLGVSFPRWVENELRHSSDFLSRSVKLCEEIFSDVRSFAAEKRVPLGINVESVSVRREELDAAVELFNRLAKTLE